MESMNVAEAKRRFSELLDRVGKEERFVVTRRGRPAAALVPPHDASIRDEPARLGLLAFVGALSEWPHFDGLMREIVADRANHMPAPAPELDA